MATSFKIYVNGDLHVAFYSQTKFMAEVKRLEEVHGQMFNQAGGFLASNVKTK